MPPPEETLASPVGNERTQGKRVSGQITKPITKMQTPWQQLVVSPLHPDKKDSGERSVVAMGSFNAATLSNDFLLNGTSNGRVKLQPNAHGMCLFQIETQNINVYVGLEKGSGPTATTATETEHISYFFHGQSHRPRRARYINLFGKL